MSAKSLRPNLPPPPPELKPLAPYYLRAQEISSRDPIVSYWCKMHLATSAFQYTVTFPQIKPWLKILLEVLEWEKKSLAHEEAISNNMVAQAHVENFAYRIFSMADNDDRAGKATDRTAKGFLAASQYLDVVVSVFQKEDNDELKEKIKYAKWRAATLLKQALTAPPTATELTAPPRLPAQSFSLEPVSTMPQEVSPVAPVFVPTASPSARPSSTTNARATPPYDIQVISGAQKHAKFAISALEYDDIPTAVQHLRLALALLEPYQTAAK